MNGDYPTEAGAAGSPRSELTGEELHVYALALKLQGMAFYLPPSAAFVAGLMADGLLDEWPLGADHPATRRGLEWLRTELAAHDPAALLPALRTDYTALFVGLDRVAAPPWESVYLSRDHLIFDVQTLEVRDAYARFGLQIPKLDREPDDHIGFELLFLSHLMELAAQARDRGELAEVDGLLAAAQEFLQAHPQQWVPLFVERVDRAAGTGYYRGWAQLLLGSLAALTALVDDKDATVQPTAGVVA